MDQRADEGFQYVLGVIVKGMTGLTLLLGFLAGIPITLWLAWAHHLAAAISVVLTLFCLAFAWGLVSLFQVSQSLSKLALGLKDSTRLFAGPRPTDPSELRAWRWGWQFLCAVMAVLFCMIAIPVASWLAGQ